MHFNIKNKVVFIAILLISALMISLMSAAFSIYGITSLFSGGSTYVMLMATSIELGKLVAVTYLFQFWKDSSRLLKSYLFFAVIILMIITSAGIFGFLTMSFQKTASGLETHESEIGLLKQQKLLLVSENDRNRERITYLQNLRDKQESRLDKAFEDRRGTKSLNSDIKSTAIEIKELNSKIDINNTKIDSANIKILRMENQLSVGEIGPMKYIATMFNTDINTVAKWFIIILIIVFDPLAVALLIASNNVIRLRNEEKEKVINEKQNVYSDNFLNTIKSIEDNLNKSKEIENINNSDKTSKLKVPKEYIHHGQNNIKQKDEQTLEVDLVAKKDSKEEVGGSLGEGQVENAISILASNKIDENFKSDNEVAQQNIFIESKDIPQQNLDNNIVVPEDNIKQFSENIQKEFKVENQITAQISNEVGENILNDNHNIVKEHIENQENFSQENNINAQSGQLIQDDKDIQQNDINIYTNNIEKYYTNNIEKYISDIENNIIENDVKDIVGKLSENKNNIEPNLNNNDIVDINKYVEEILNKNNINSNIHKSIGPWKSNNFH